VTGASDPPRTDRSERVTVVYVVSGTRSGSTILDTLLGGIDGWFSSGELRFLWERGVLEQRRCGCGLPVLECPVWAAVLSRDVDGGRLDATHARDVVDWQRATLRLRHTWRVLRIRDPLHAEDAALASYASVLGRLYRSIAAETGAGVIVDSSKHPSDAALLRSIPGVDPYFVHVVRDPRAVVHSWKRQKPDPDGQEEMPRWSVLDTALNWDVVNAAADSLARAVGPGRLLRLRYEDLAREPLASVRAVAALAGHPDAELPFVDDHTARLRPNHTVSGNPNRFRTGETIIELDDEWASSQSWIDRWATTALTFPMLLRYRYPLVPDR
jgi:hypothetical protein